MMSSKYLRTTGFALLVLTFLGNSGATAADELPPAAPSVADLERRVRELEEIVRRPQEDKKADLPAPVPAGDGRRLGRGFARPRGTGHAVGGDFFLGARRFRGWRRFGLRRNRRRWVRLLLTLQPADDLLQLADALFQVGDGGSGGRQVIIRRSGSDDSQKCQN